MTQTKIKKRVFTGVSPYGKFKVIRMKYAMTIQTEKTGTMINRDALPMKIKVSKNLYKITVQRKKQKVQQAKKSNISSLTGNDIADLSQALHIDINKLNTAVLELVSSRKAV